MQQEVKVSKEGAKRDAFVPSLRELLSDPCGDDATWGQSQLLATVTRKGPREDQGAGWAGEVAGAIPCSCLCLPV